MLPLHCTDTFVGQTDRVKLELCAVRQTTVTDKSWALHSTVKLNPVSPLALSLLSIFRQDMIVKEGGNSNPLEHRIVVILQSFDK